jgi:hypothetical protein
LTSAGVAFAQDATLSGLVKDPSGAAVPGASVSIVKTDTQKKLTTTSSDFGLYTFSSVAPGPYEIQVDKIGFQPLVHGDLTLHVGDRVEINLTLTVGNSKEEVTVLGNQEQLQTEDASVSTVVERQMVEDMPLNGRSFQSLLSLTPGINPVGPGPTNGGVNQQGQFTVNGQRGGANYFTVDGVSANAGSSAGVTLGQAGAGALPATTALGGFNGLVSIDALEEFRVTTSTFAPEYGRTPGGQVALITRSGTNSFHGNIFDYLRNTAFDANDWFLNRVGITGAEHQNDFGAVFGGPILKDKVFFFASYEGLRLTNPQAGLTDTFTQSARSLAASVTNSATLNYSGYMAQILTAYPLPTIDRTGNITLGNGRVVPAGAPCTSDALNCVAFYTGASPSTSRLDAGSIRLDYSLSNNLTLFGRYVDSPSSTLSQGSAIAVNNSGISLGSRSATIGATSILSSAVTNDLRFNYSHAGLQQYQTAPTFGGTMNTLFPSGFAQPGSYLSAQIHLAFQFLGLVPDLNVAKAPTTDSRQRQFNIVDGLTAVKGSHTLKTGLDFRLLSPSIRVSPYSLTGVFYQPGVTSGPTGASGGSTAGPPPGGPSNGPAGCGTVQNLLPQFVCGFASTAIVQGNSEQDFRIPEWSLYIQDTWRTAKGFTLTYGARYEVTPAPHSINGKPFFSLNNFDPAQCTTPISAASATAGMTQCNVGANPLGTAPYGTRWGNLAPRVGIAWQLSQDPRWATVLRGGFGRFYDAGGDATAGLGSPYSPTAYAKGVQFPVSMAQAGAVAPPAVQTEIGAGSPYTTPAFGGAPGLRLPLTYQFNVALQQAIGRQQTVTLSYVGAHGRDLIGAVTLFPIIEGTISIPVSPTFHSNMIVYGNYATSTYNALQIQFQRHFYNGLGATASYTWAHSIDDASEFNAGNEGGAGNFPLSVNRGSSDFDIRHTFTASMVYDVPAPYKRPLAKGILGHWSIDPIYHFQTALPVNVLAGTNYDGNILIIQRPNLIQGVAIYVYGAQCAAQNAGNYCAGGWGFNNAAQGTPLGATVAEASAAGCQPNSAVGAFCKPPGVNASGSVYVQGTLGRNALRGFALQQFDLALHREFAVGDRLRLRFEADGFNIFNHPSFSSPENNISLPRFGIASSMLNSSFGTGNATTGGGYNSLYSLGGPRSIQLALKLIF